MKYFIFVTIIIMVPLRAYETKNFVNEEGLIIAVEGIANAQQADKPLPPDFFVEDVIEKGLCYVGQTFTIKAAIQSAEHMFKIGKVLFETDNDSIVFLMDTVPLIQSVACDYYQDGGTYTFPIYINGINIYKRDDPLFNDIIGARKDKKNAPLFVVSSVVMITEGLRKELQDADCWGPDKW